MITLPLLILTLNYFLVNNKTRFKINYETQTLTINQNGKVKSFQFEDINTSVYHLGIYYKNFSDAKYNLGARRSTPWSDFGYWYIQLKDGSQYYLSTFVHDLIFEYPIVKNTLYKYSLVPLLIPRRTITGKPMVCKLDKSRYYNLYERYSNYPTHKLEEIIKNPMEYQEIAVKIANELYSKKTNVG